MADSDFERAVDALFLSLRGLHDLASDDLRIVEHELGERLRRRFPAMDPADRSDVIADALVRVFTAVRQGRFDPHGSPVGYLWTATLHRAIDLTRRPSTVSLEEVSAEAHPRSDDEIVALLDADASSAHVIGAMRLAGEAGDHEVAKLAAEWLVVAERLGYAPPLREAAAAIGTSYPTLQRALSRFRGYLEQMRQAG